MIRTLIFDFDGVLVDSNAIKQNAYLHIFKPLNVPAEVVEATIRSHPHADRFGVIRAVLSNRHWLAKESANLLKSLAAQYNELCEESTVKCPEIDGASEILPDLARRYVTAVNSDTPRKILVRIIRQRGWESWFRAIRGRPESKAQNLHSILADAGTAPRDSLFIGDHQTDWNAAVLVGCHFAGLENSFNDFKSRPPTLIQSLRQLPGLLAQENTVYA